MINAGIIGVGSFGEKRVAAIKSCAKGALIGLADANADRAMAVAKNFDIQYYSVEDLLANEAINAVLICIPNKYHASVAVAALQAGKHILCEKPLARNVEEAQQIVDAARQNGKMMKTGANHRYFLSVMKAYEIFKSGFIGDIVSFNGRIGNSGERIKNSWFWDKDMSGGGTLLDNGCHLLDIARWFMGDFVEASGMITNSYWKDCPVEDTATGVFLNKEGKIATINSSWRQLSGYFYFEVNGTDGYITVDGRFDTHGGDNIYWRSIKHGGEIYSLNYGQTKPNSYQFELDAFFESIEKGMQPTPSGEDGLEVIRMVEAIYKSNNQTVAI